MGCPLESQRKTEITMRRSFLILRIVGIGIALGGGAISCSFSNNSETREDMGDASELRLIIKDLNVGKTNEAKQLLNLELNTDIIKIAMSLEHCDEKTRHDATNLFSKIALDRREHPAGDYKDTNYTVVREHISNILESASSK
jgi:hypothetical protein